jgi:uncharacterized membrane protein SpoIIM required for sporulation
VHYLHQLVGRAHNQLYRSRSFNFRAWRYEMFTALPRRLYADRCFRLALLIFWGIFLAGAYLAYTSPEFSEQMLGESAAELENSFSQPIEGRPSEQSSAMVGFYINHNTGIGLQCFAAGLLLGIGGLFATVFNAAYLGAAFGYMATVTHGENFFHFVTAHGPFELTAIVLSAAAGMRLGFSLVDTKGMSRAAALRQASHEAMPAMGAAMVLFMLAGLIEAFLSPSAAPYAFKAAVAILSTILLVFYVVVLGYPRRRSVAAR